MEFIAEIADRKTIQKLDIGINQFLIENNVSQIEKILNFFKSNNRLLLVNGFMGTGKTMVVNQSLSMLNEDVITLKYNCFETTILDDILLEFFDDFKRLTVQNIIKAPKTKTENFTQKINAYFESIDKPTIIVINSFEQILKENKTEILNFLNYISKYEKIKTILIARKFEYDDFKSEYEKVSISAFEKGIFEKYLKSEDLKQIGPLSDELYKHTRGYYLYTTLAIKIMQLRKLSLTEFLSGYTKSFLSFNDFILREALSLVDPVSGHLFRFLTIMRHPVNVKLLKSLNLYDADKIAFFTDNLVLAREGAMVYLQDYYKVIAENSIAENIAIKIHKNCIELYNLQLPLKPLERDLLISRQTMRKEIEYHTLFLPKKPIFIPKQETKQINTVINPIPKKTPQNKVETDKKIKKISFVFESEENESAIMNKIANSINRFIDISDKQNKTLEEIKKLPLVNLINLAKKEEENFNYQKVVMIYQKALTLNMDDDYYTFLPSIYTRLANAFKHISDWFNSLKYFELAVEFYISTGDPEKISECKYEIANIYYITFKRELAEKILKEILSEDVSVNLKIKSQLLLANITGESVKNIIPQNTNGIEKNVLAELYFKSAVNFDEEGNIETAVKYYKKCIETSQDIKINPFLSSSLTNLASIYDENGQSNIAIKYLQESLRLDESTQNYNGIYISSMKLAEIISEKDTNKTLNYLKKAKSCALELNETFYIASTDLAIGDFHYSQKDFTKALQYYINAYKLAENNFTKENISKIKLRINELKYRIDEENFNKITKELNYEE